MSIDFMNVPTPPVMTMTISIIVHMATCVGFGCEVAANKQREAKPRHHQSRSYSQPWVESFRQDPLRCVKRDEAERVHRNRMRCSHNHAEKHRMASLAARSNQVCGNESLTMSRFKRVKST